MDSKSEKDKLHKIFSKDSFLSTGANASGDYNVLCQFCGDERNLHSFYDTYTKDGDQKTYDQLVYDCFGIKVEPKTGMICDRCIYKLHMTLRFRALIVAAVAVPNDMVNHSKAVIKKSSNNFLKEKSTLDLIKKKKKTIIERKWRYQRQSSTDTNVQMKRKMNLSCTLCRQRYPMMVPFEGWKNFVCSRCKKNNKPGLGVTNKCMTSSSNVKDRFLIRNKTEKSRLFNFPKNAPQTSRGDLGTSRGDLPTSRHQPYPIRYISRNLPVYYNGENTIDHHCDMCGRDLKTQDLLNRHMRTHKGQPIYRCDVCRRVFKDKNSFRTHYIGHEK